jgi:histidinol-phosphate/aromatic aminotransferase/cobyric acid decarboxylase-like protein
VSQVNEGKRILAQKAVELGFEPISTHANFMLVRVMPRCEPRRLVDALRELGYLVRGAFSAPCIADCIRITAGPPPMMIEFAEALERAVRQVTA